MLATGGSSVALIDALEGHLTDQRRLEGLLAGLTAGLTGVHAEERR